MTRKKGTASGDSLTLPDPEAERVKEKGTPFDETEGGGARRPSVERALKGLEDWHIIAKKYYQSLGTGREKNKEGCFWTA